MQIAIDPVNSINWIEFQFAEKPSPIIQKLHFLNSFLLANAYKSVISIWTIVPELSAHIFHRNHEMPTKTG